MKIIDKSNYKLPAGISKILLIQLGDIGDVVWTIPSIRAIKNSIPGANISIMLKDSFGALLEADPAIDHIYEIKQYRGNLFHQALRRLSFIKCLRAQNFDLVVDLRLGDRGAFMSFASGALLRVTMHHPEGVPFWRKYFFTHGVAIRPPVHTYGAADQSLCILRELGIDTDDIIPRLEIANSVQDRVRKILIAEKVDELNNWITVNPFSRWQYKEWNDLKWIEIFNWLGKDLAIPLIIVGSPEERSKAEALISRCEARVFNFVGRTDLAELAGILNRSCLHIGVDSAAPHIAAAVGTPTITIYGPSSWQDWAPVGDNHRVIVADMDCVPCRQKGCDNNGRSRCLEELDTGKVKKIISEAIVRRRM